jgi:hypothetical protein
VSVELPGFKGPTLTSGIERLTLLRTDLAFVKFDGQSNAPTH